MSGWGDDFGPPERRRSIIRLLESGGNVQRFSQQHVAEVSAAVVKLRKVCTLVRGLRSQVALGRSIKDALREMKEIQSLAKPLVLGVRKIISRPPTDEYEFDHQRLAGEFKKELENFETASSHFVRTIKEKAASGRQIGLADKSHTNLVSLKRDSGVGSSSSAASSSSSASSASALGGKRKESNARVAEELASITAHSGLDESGFADVLDDPDVQSLLRDRRGDKLIRFCDKFNDHSRTECEEISRALVAVFAADEQLVPFTKKILEVAVNRSKTVESLIFTHDNVLKKSLSHAFKALLGRTYLDKTIGSVVRDLCKNQRALNPKTNGAQLMQTAQKLLDDTFTTATAFPADCAHVCKVMKQKVVQKFPKDAKYPVLEKFIFFQFSAIVLSPHPILVEDKPSPTAQRSLINLAKILQALYQKTKGTGVREGYMESVNNFNFQNLNKVMTLFEELIGDKTAEEDPDDDGGRSWSKISKRAPGARTRGQRVRAVKWDVLAGAISRTEKYKNITPGDAAKLERELLVPDSGMLALVFDDMTISQARDFVPQLYTLYTLKGSTTKLVKWAIEQEVNDTDKVENLFVGNSPYIYLLSHHINEAGIDWSKESLGPTLGKLLKETDPLKFEINPRKLPEGYNVDQNVSHLLNYVQELINNVCSSASSCPLHIKLFLKHLADTCEAKFPGSKLPTVGSFVFLRFISPSLISPAQHGLLPEDPPRNTKRCIILITKVIQKLANLVNVTGSDATAIDTSQFALKNLGSVFKFVEIVMSNNGVTYKNPSATTREVKEAVMRVKKAMLA